MSRTAATAAGALLCMGLALAGCGRGAQTPAAICASDGTLARIKQMTFERAAAQASSQNRYAVPRLAAQAKASLVKPLVAAFDRDTRKTSCTATLAVSLPAGVLSTAALRSPIAYASQPTADGRDVAFSASGLEEIAAGIAGADLHVWAARNAPSSPGLVVEMASADRTTAVAPPARPAPPIEKASPQREPEKAPPFVSAPRPAAPPPRPLPPRKPAPSAPAEAAAPPSSYAATSADGPVRVFVHIADGSGRAEAEAVRARLNDLMIGGQPVAAPAIRMVTSLPRRTEVRCLKAADCAAARRVAAYLAGQLGGSVAVVDMSRTYEGDPGVRRGSLELWLRAD